VSTGAAGGLTDIDATAQADLVRRGEVQPSELIEAAISRIEAENGNSVIHPLYDKARASAAGKLPDGPFRGVPFLVKDAVCHTAGDPYHLGMRFLKRHGYVARHDTELARRFRAAGFVFVGKTNTPELALSTTTEPLAYGATHNPWQLDHSPGGSSGGSAAAVAAHWVGAAHANDMGGSIRIPASHCGLVGLKPTRARGTLAPDLGEYWGPLTHEHVVTRSVRDSAAILDAVAGPAPGDPYTAPPPARPWREEVGAPAGELRIGVVTRSPLCDIHPDCIGAVEATARVLESLGHRPEMIDMPGGTHSEVGPWIPAAIARELDRWSERVGEPITADDMEPANWMMAEIGRAMSASVYVAATEQAFAWAREICTPFGHAFDLLLTPTATTPPPPLGWASPDQPIPTLMERLNQSTVFTMPFDVTGQPAISLPATMNGDGLPIGIQLAAESGREDLLFRVAAQLEQAQPWASRRPPALG